MLMVSRLAKRSIFRNTRRTLLTIGLIGCSLAAILFTDAFVKGTEKSMIKASTSVLLGEAQIHKPGFREVNDIDLYLPHYSDILKRLLSFDEVRAASARVMTSGMISSTENVTGALVYGVRAEDEANVSKLKQAVIAGSYLSGKEGEILIGYDMADLLEVEMGDRIVITVSEVDGGQLAQALFRLSGIFRFNERNMDKSVAFINLDQAQSMLGMTGDKKGVHEIAIRLNQIDDADNPNLALWRAFSPQEIELLNWRALMPQLDNVLDLTGFSTAIVAVIMFVLVALGVVNTMFMSIYERHHEFGILLALGTRPLQLFWQILMEGFLIGCLGTAAGLVIAGLLVGWLSISGFDYGAMEVSGISLNEPIFPVVVPWQFVKLSGFILAVTVLASVYPAAHAARLSPSMAMRTVL